MLGEFPPVLTQQSTHQHEEWRLQFQDGLDRFSPILSSEP